MNGHKTVFYAAVGPALTLYDLDVEAAAVTRRGTVSLPANVQYAWQHPTGRWLYVASSDGGPAQRGSRHHASVFDIDPDSGALTSRGTPLPLPARPIHLSVSGDGHHLLVAYNNPSSLTVHALAADGTIGAAIPQGPLDTGIYAHQIRTTPSGRSVIMVTRGNDAADGRPEDSGALKIYGFEDGRLTDRASIAPGGGYGFGPRHLDFHPTRPWVFLSIERQAQIQLFRMSADEMPEAAPAFSEGTLREPANLRGRQPAGPIRVHPNGGFAYVSNRTDSRLDAEGRRMASGGEDSIAVFAIDPASGRPRRIQLVDTPGKHVRNMAIEPGGRVLIASNILAVQDRAAAGRLVPVPACIATFRIGADGKLTLANVLEVETGGAMQFWSGTAVLPRR